jgi:hypothetical protein
MQILAGRCVVTVRHEDIERALQLILFKWILSICIQVQFYFCQEKFELWSCSCQKYWIFLSLGWPVGTQSEDLGIPSEIFGAPTYLKMENANSS